MDTITTYHYDTTEGRVNVTVKYDADSQLVIHQYEGQPQNNKAKPASWWIAALERTPYDNLMQMNKTILDFLRSI